MAGAYVEVMKLSMLRSGAAFGLALILLVALVGCGSDSPSSPSGDGGATLRGTVVGLPSAASRGEVAAFSTAVPYTVRVQEDPNITATIAADGTFTLRGLPSGSFTLLFFDGTTPIGSLLIDGVNANQEITLTVAVTGGTVTVIEQRRNGIGHGDLEIEGRVESIGALNPAGESRFVIDGRTVVARPGETSIREGNRNRTVNDVTVGRRVHVKGVWLAPAAGSTTQEVLAHEIKLQGGGVDDGAGETPGGGQPACAAGTNAQVEGRISAKGAGTITVPQHGRDNVAQVDGGTRIRHGNTTYTFDQLQVGWRVHVSGRFLGLAGTVCNVDADQVMVQGNN
jgi:hypothetical protein